MKIYTVAVLTSGRTISSPTEEFSAEDLETTLHLVRQSLSEGSWLGMQDNAGNWHTLNPRHIESLDWVDIARDA